VGKRGEGQVNFLWVQSRRQQEQSSCGVLLFSTDYPDFVNMPFSLTGSLAEPCLPWLGPCLPAKRPLTELRSCQVLLPLPQSPYLQGSLAEPCSPPLAGALPSQHKGP
jgi:hypothetical protein